jgi:TolB protein
VVEGEVDRLEIVGNGQVVAEIPLDRNRMSVSSKITLTVKESGWYLVRARGNRPEYPVLDVYPYAITSPIYVTVGGRPIRSRADAEYFIAWIDRLQTAASKHPDWNTEAERTSSMDLLRRAREEFVRRLSQ